LSYGFVSGRTIGDWFSRFDAEGGGTFENIQTGNMFATYRIFVGNKAALGVTAGMQQISANEYPEGHSGPLLEAYNLTNITVAAEIMWLYLNRPHIQSYGLFGCGTSFYHKTND